MKIANRQYDMNSEVIIRLLGDVSSFEYASFIILLAYIAAMIKKGNNWPYSSIPLRIISYTDQFPRLWIVDGMTASVRRVSSTIALYITLNGDSIDGVVKAHRRKPMPKNREKINKSVLYFLFVCLCTVPIFKQIETVKSAIHRYKTLSGCMNQKQAIATRVIRSYSKLFLGLGIKYSSIGINEYPTVAGIIYSVVIHVPNTGMMAKLVIANDSVCDPVNARDNIYIDVTKNSANICGMHSDTVSGEHLVN